jgi:hypothetical protein
MVQDPSDVQTFKGRVAVFIFCAWDTFNLTIFFFFSLAKQALYHLSHISSPFCPGCFGDWDVCQDWSRTTVLSISASQVV